LPVVDADDRLLRSPQYERSKSAYDILTSSTDAKGRKIEIIKMPLPPPLFITQVLPSSCSSQSLLLLRAHPASMSC